MKTSSPFKLPGPGRILWLAFYKPTARIRWLFGYGFKAMISYLLGERAMRRSARTLKPVKACRDSEPLSCSFLTGKRHWQHSVWCAYSLGLRLPGGILPTFYDDGSLGQKEISWLLQVFPGGRVITGDLLRDSLDKHLPRHRFPLLRRACRQTMMRKFAGIRAAQSGWQLYLDSDMLFFHRPVFLEDCAQNLQACHMHDHGEGFYVRPAPELEKICGCAVLPLVNGGIIGLDDRKIDWELLETWCSGFKPEELDHFLFEQTLTGMLMSHLGSLPTPAHEYRIVFSQDTAPPENEIMRHYLYRSKLQWISRDWKLVLAQGQNK